MQDVQRQGQDLKMKAGGAVEVKASARGWWHERRHASPFWPQVENLVELTFRRAEDHVLVPKRAKDRAWLVLRPARQSC